MEVFNLCAIALATVFLTWILKLTAPCGRRSRSKANKEQQLLLPPGPWTLPMIGSLHHVVSLLPHRRITELCRRHGPLMLLRLGEVPTVVVSSAEAAAVVMKTNDLVLASRPRTRTLDIFSCGGKGIGFAPYGDHWRQMRKVCVVELLRSARQVRRLEGIRAEEVGNLLRSITASASAGAAVNVSDKLSALANDVVSRAVFGGTCAGQDDYLRELEKVIVLLGGFSLVDLFPSSRLVRWFSNGEHDMKKSCDRLHRVISDIIEARKAARAAGHGASSSDDVDDLLDAMLRLQEEDSLAIPLTTQTIGVVIFDIFLAATDTTGRVLEWAMSELLNNPEVMAKVQLEVRGVLGQGQAVITNTDLSELHYLRMFIKEVLRMHPPAPLLVPREAREDCEIMGYDIPRGTNIYVNVFAISRDPRYWDNPEDFKPERFENNKIDYFGTHFEFTPFGAGRRQCPGILFGTSTVEIALANLLYHFNWVHRNEAGGESLDMTEKFGITVRRRSGLQLIATPYVASSAT
uniref:Uncharacterized protein n=1 Tax=Avena sativa TaxID=4498 RepID=A0ACD5WJU5_AVESA